MKPFEQALFEAIARKLSAAYPAAKIYQNAQAQGIKTPCFFIELIRLSVPRGGLSKRSARTLDLQVSAIGFDLQASLAVGARLLEDLAVVEVPESKLSLRALGQSCHKVGADLHYQCHFSYSHAYKEDHETMQSLEQEASLED